MKIAAVLFDLDGTLLNTLDDLCDSVNAVLLAHSFSPITKEATASYLGNGAGHLIHCALPSGISEEEEAGILAEYKAYYAAHCRIKTAPFPGILEMLGHLQMKGIRMAVVSNKPDPAVRELNATFFGDLLETAIGEKKEIRRKPAPDTLLEAMRLLGADREECVYIGDTEVDLQTAANAGLRCICVAWGFRSVEELRAAGAGTIVTNAYELERCIL